MAGFNDPIEPMTASSARTRGRTLVCCNATLCFRDGPHRPLALQETSVRTFAYFHTRPAAPAPSLFLAKSNGCNLSESCHRAVSRVLHFNGSVGAVGERALWDRLFRSWPPFEFHKRVRRFAAGGPF